MRGNHVNVGIVGLGPLFRVLSSAGRADVQHFAGGRGGDQRVGGVDSPALSAICSRGVAEFDVGAHVIVRQHDLADTAGASVIGEMTQQIGHQPSNADLAESIGCSEAEVREALQADLMMQPASLDAPLAEAPDAPTLGDALGQDDPAMEHMLAMEAVHAHWAELPKREQRILMMRFYGDMTQAEIGRSLGISQMHVSRLLAHALGLLRQRIASPAPRVA